MPRKPRSPFRGMSRDDIARLRSCVRETLNWERALGTPNQYLEPVYRSEVYELPFRLFEHVKDRSVRRWQDAPHYAQSRLVYEDQHMQRYNQNAWEKRQLTKQVRALRTEVAELRTIVTGEQS